MFSSDEVSSYINDHFEPAWESVRPVPIVTIDFGNGHKITRTLNGNVATYVCAADGVVLDILPGVYTADVYRKQLEQLVLMHRYAFPGGPADITGLLNEYHQGQASLLAKDQPPAVFIENPNPGVSILGVERPVLLVAGGGSNRGVDRVSRAAPAAPSAENLAGWKELAEDTRINETVRRKQIHEKLATAGRVQPKDITKWLYKEVLKADLDDPYLGLSDVLNKQYPFAAEDDALKKK
ncbi:MAG TPA: hypothetical protein VKE74_22160 [Gemmataceae bacterium]|nr:hypothetical protein [Gemmataceae bacterium]